VELGILEIEEIEAVVEREHRAAVLAQRHGADVALDRPVLGLAGLGIEAPDRGLPDPPPGAVDPVELAFLDIPDRAFAQMIVALQDQLDLHAARSARPARSRSPAETSAFLMRSISACGILTSGGGQRARGSLPSSTSASFMRLCMSTHGSE